MATAVKTKKIETPIDERDTFVSLQKNFADSGVSVEEKLKTLYSLQVVDNEIEEIVQLRGELPAEVSALENAIQAIEAKLANSKALIKEYENSIEANKAQIVELDADIAKYQKELEGVANSREFDTINKDLENQGLLRQIAEKHIGEAKVKIEEQKELIESLEAKRASKNEDLEAKKVELDVIVESTAKQEAELNVKRAALAEKIDERTMSAYNRIRKSVHNHLAVVTVFDGSSCGGCFSRITPQRLIDIATGKKLVICEHCGRIIVNPNPEA